MKKTKQLYIDAEGVRRGYYVYLHKDKATGEVFYVGKGAGRRAWACNGRPDEWYKRIATLSAGWDIEVVAEDLSEHEAFQLEAECVEKYGGCQANGGTLTNWLPGGEIKLAIEIGIAYDDHGWSKAYYDARNFKRLPRPEEESFVRQLATTLDTHLLTLNQFKTALETRANDRIEDNILTLDCIIGSLNDSILDFLKRRCSWKDMCISLEEALDDLIGEFDRIRKYGRNTKTVLQKARMAITAALGEIDTGNRAEAERIADNYIKDYGQQSDALDADTS